jgi:hypothetical protein
MKFCKAIDSMFCQLVLITFISSRAAFAVNSLGVGTMEEKRVYGVKGSRVHERSL